MELVDFLRQTQAEVRSEIGERLGAQGSGYPYAESVFAEVVMQHMSQSPFKIATPISTRSGYTSSRIGKQKPRILSREK